MLLMQRFVPCSEVAFAEKIESIRALGISHVVNVTQHFENSFETSGIKYFKVPVLNVKGGILEVIFVSVLHLIKRNTF